MVLPFPYPIDFVQKSYNELLTQTGEMRSHWRPFFDAVLQQGIERLPTYAQQAIRLMNTEILTVAGKEKYSYGLIPFLLSEQDFDIIKVGLIQRAEVLNKTLADLYGDQTTILKGVLPAGIVFGHPSYLPALKNIKPVDGIFLREYSVDIERAPDGTFWVVEDETEIPNGSSLAIKNRLVLSRVMPEIYQKTAPEKIIGFFQALRQHLVSFASEKYKTPLIVLLSQSEQEAYAQEDASFARNLGISVVDPADLSVRNNLVYLKNIGGLKKVDVILRRIKDDLCDPLELNGASLLGVAGLVQSVRAGKVALVNPLGTALGNIPALRSFIHGLCDFFNHQPLLLPSIASWWCGQKKECDFVLENMSHLKILNATTGQEVVVSANDIAKNPNNFVAQETVNSSYTPILENNSIVPAKVRLRFHLIYNQGQYHVMAGGLAFTHTSVQKTIRDIWIPSSAEKKKNSPVVLPSELQSQIRPVRTTFELTSRTADNMFWLGRNLERSEGVSRVLRAYIRRLVESPEIPEPNELRTLLSILAVQGYIPMLDFGKSDQQKQAQKEVQKTICSPDTDFGLVSLFDRMRFMADGLRDRLSMDTWEIFTCLSDLLPTKNSNNQVILNRLNSIILQQNAISGLIRENMTREHSWRFMEIGRRLERAMYGLSLMSGVEFCAKNGFNAALGTLLEVFDSRMTYRARYMSVPSVHLVFDLLVCDPTNPRALLYQVIKLRQNISVLKKESANETLFDQELGLLQSILDKINKIDVMTLSQQTKTLDETVTMNPLVTQQLSVLDQELSAFSDSLTTACFVHALPTRQGPLYEDKKL